MLKAANSYPSCTGVALASSEPRTSAASATSRSRTDNSRRATCAAEIRRSCDRSTTRGTSLRARPRTGPVREISPRDQADVVGDGFDRTGDLGRDEHGNERRDRDHGHDVPDDHTEEPAFRDRPSSLGTSRSKSGALEGGKKRIRKARSFPGEAPRRQRAVLRTRQRLPHRSDLRRRRIRAAW